MTTTPVASGLRGRAAWLLAALMAALLSLQVGLAEPAAAATPVTYVGPTFVAGGPNPTEDKPQSKLWYNDGSWWALMRAAAGGGVTIHQLRSDHTWLDTRVVVDDRPSSTGDALWENGKLYVASRTSGGALRALRFGYDATTDTYTRESAKQVAGNGTESMSVARDSTGKLWVTYMQGSPRRVYVAYSTDNGNTWSAPFLIPVSDNTATNDDIAGVVAFGGKVGVMWSDQEQDVMRFAVHVDTAPVTTWTLESALPNPSLGGANLADDHLNLKSLTEGSDGSIFAAVKTSRGDAGEPSTDPSIVVLKRSATGTWSGAVAARVGDKLTRSQIALDNMGKLYVLMSMESGGNTIYYKTTSQSSPSFGTGKGAPFVQYSGALMNDASTTKQTVTAATGLVVLAADDESANKRYYHGELALGTTTADTTAPSAPTNVAGTPTANSVALTWTASTDNVGVTGYRIFRTGIQVGTSATTSYTDTGLTASTTYSYTVAAVDAAQNVSAKSSPASVTTLAGSTDPEPGTGVSFVGAATATSATTSVSAPAPAGVQTGDVLVAAVSTRGSTTITAPAGWTQVRLDANGSTMVQGIYTKVANGSDSSAWTVSRSYGTVVQVLAYRGVDTAAPVVASGGTLSTTTVISSPSVASVANGRAVTIAGIARTATLAPSAPLTERSEVTTDAAATYKVTADAADTATTGTTSGAFNTTASGSAGGIGQTVTLRPRA